MNMARAQLNYDNRLPPDDSMREAAIEARKEQLAADYWQDLEHLSDALDDAVYRLGNYKRKRLNHPRCVEFLTLLRDGSDDIELARMIRECAQKYIADTASDQAEEEFGE
jgi:hypothetical protein